MRKGSLAISTFALVLTACATNGGQDVTVTGHRADSSHTENLPPPPPPPPALIRAAPVQGAYIPAVQIPQNPGRERYEGEEVSPVHLVAQEPVSTFSVDVDTGAYANTRRILMLGQKPPQDAVRTEELINYFRYDYPAPQNREVPFTVSTDLAMTPWNPDTRLLRIGLRGYDLPRDNRPPANLVFLLDVSGSMSSADKLPLVKSALTKLADNLRAQDRVSIVVYAGAAGVVLDPTNDKRKIRRALDALNAGGSTAGGAGLQLAYNIAEDNLIEGGVNRIILATDGDFNVGIRDPDALIELVEKERDRGITLTTLGFGTGNYNEAMMEQIADHGNGNYAYIDSAMEAEKVLVDEMSSTLFTIAKDVKIQVEFNPAKISQYRLIGYENRALREEDFANDAVDAGDIGAGHQVTALYEVVMAGTKGWVAPRRYEPAAPAADSSSNSELAFVKLRYKLPNGEVSKLIERPVPSAMLYTARPAAGDMAFVAAVAAYGQKLRGDPMLAQFTYDDIEKLAGTPSDFWRQEFVQLVKIADSLDGR
ncbi:DUF3520 domain-containing protein [Altererythrobacter indicus]|uniref:DUF3520 domain-containing protein n=2 Tax=Altericroceibacterium indicum TaxID=374177 RepID=A0A845A732_9SPHN|nr:VWA domain-containing protein [Altericroceibacterium indicum]MXP26020.1 DUF3520 domain-containing protein [Altericroceibacterium indicum]